MKGFGVLAAASCAAIALLAGSMPAEAAKVQGDILVRLRGIYIEPDVSSSLTLGNTAIPGKVDADFQIVPEIDFSYFLTDNIAFELIAATAKHDVSVKGSPLGANVDLGHVWVLPPTLTAQYHFAPKAAFSPYVGAGINYTIYYNQKSGAARSVNYDNDFGLALQAGVDYWINDKWFLNLDVKKLWLNADAKVDAGLGTLINAKVDLDPWIFGIGVGTKF